MNLFKKLFGKKDTVHIQCPRCLGKGHVDMNDIKRLEQELRWRPGKCAYCNGTGSVASDQTSKLAVDEPYLTTNISKEERERLIEHDHSAIRKMKEYNNGIERAQEKIIQLHFTNDLSSEDIADWLSQYNPDLTMEQIIEYVNKVIAHANKIHGFNN